MRLEAQPISITTSAMTSKKTSSTAKKIACVVDTLKIETSSYLFFGMMGTAFFADGGSAATALGRGFFAASS